MRLMEQSSVSSDFHFFTLALLREVVREGIMSPCFLIRDKLSFRHMFKMQVLLPLLYLFRTAKRNYVPLMFSVSNCN